MKIKDGGSTQNITGIKVEEIKIVASNNYTFNLWINDSLSYLTLEEALQLKDEIVSEIKKSVTK